MFKHYLILFTCLLMFIVGSQNISAQQQIALDTYAIFEQSCLVCHGPNGAYKESLLMEHNALIEKGSVVPGNPDASELYNRLITTETAKRMPLGQPQLTAQSTDTIRNWILSGAPDWTAPPITDGDFISPAEILSTIETHLMSLSSFDRAFARYFTMTHLYNAGEPVGILQEYRKALYKLVNSLSWGSTVINPTPIDPQGTIFYIDLRHYEWDRNDGWTQIEAEYPYHISFDAPTQTALKAQLGRLQGEMKTDIPAIHVDWFVAQASLPPLYHDLLSLPLTDRELETRLEVDVIRNLVNAPGVRVWRAGTNASGVSNHNRVVERHISRYGAYWKSYDFAGSVGTQNIFTHPLSFTHDGGEVIFNLPNGLQGYYITNASGFRLDEAPTNIVSNPAASDPAVRNGLSCFGCHTKGMNTFEDEVRSVIESNATPAYDKAQALRLYVAQSEMDALVGEDMDRYRVALEATGGTVDDIEPIQRFHEAFQGPIDAAYAAAVVGLETEVFLEKIRENVGLQNIGLLVLDSENGSMKRDAWTSNFRDILFALDFPQLVDKPPVVQDPDRLPGAFVHIPDTNLRAAIAEALGKSPNAPITVEEMEKLEELVAHNKDIRDLTGIQFAINLTNLDLRGNQINDISPVASLTTLGALVLRGSPVSDISPIRNLTSLDRLEIAGTMVTDLSPIRNLINLRVIYAWNTNISDISPVQNLINLGYLRFDNCNLSVLPSLTKLTKLWKLNLHNNNISDISPLAKLTGLERLFLEHNNISDLSPLTNLTKLWELNIGDNKISDLTPLTGLTNLTHLYFWENNISNISPLARLTNLKVLRFGECGITNIQPLAGLIELEELNFHSNKVSDISPLAELTQLKHLHISNNNISDFSPLDKIRENINLIWHANPGFPKGGPRIEGSWLWVTTGEGDIRRNRDALAEASGGTVTETEVATYGAIEGQPVGDKVWTRLKFHERLHEFADHRHPNPRAPLYGSLILYSPREQDTTLYLGSNIGIKTWLNGTLIHEQQRHDHSIAGYAYLYPVTLKQGQNILLVTVSTWADAWFGFEPGTEYTVANPSVSYTFSKTPIHTDDTFALNIRAENVTDLAGWQFDIAFDPTALEAIDVSEGDFLKTGGSTTFFQRGSINNAAGKITGLNAARLSAQGATGTGSLLQVNFKAKSGGETKLELQNFQFGSVTGDVIPAGPHEITISIESQLETGDVNRDGRVTILDLILVSQQLGTRVPAGSPVDVNGDGVVTILDLIFVSGQIGSTTAPAAPSTPSPRQNRDFAALNLQGTSAQSPPACACIPTYRGWGIKGVETVIPAMIEAWIAQARLEDDGSLAFKEGIENLEKLLASLIPEETALLANYPNPFNPETWIPYQLAESADVTLTIYDINGDMIWRLAVGHQPAGMYQSRTRAAYWDGRNQLGESVASGLYFYTLTAGDFTATRRMLILK